MLVRVHAASLNIADWYSVVGRPRIARPTTGIFRPRSNRPGTDYAGSSRLSARASRSSSPGTRCLAERTVRPDATVVIAGGPRANHLLGPLGHVAGMPDMETLRELLESGHRSVVDRRFAFAEMAGDLDYQGEGHPRGKVVLDVSSG